MLSLSLNQDQPVFFLEYQVNITTGSQLADPAVSTQAVESYLSNQTGPLTNVGGDMIVKGHSDIYAIPR
jgi:hypothetical protein